MLQPDSAVTLTSSTDPPLVDARLQHHAAGGVRTVGALAHARGVVLRAVLQDADTGVRVAEGEEGPVGRAVRDTITEAMSGLEASTAQLAEVTHRLEQEWRALSDQRGHALLQATDDVAADLIREYTKLRHHADVVTLQL